MKKSAFTLIELLVVISIIAILAGIALPVFNQVLERGKATQDLSGLRQLGIGTVAYLADNNDQIFSGTASGPGATWPAVLYSKYVPNWKVFKSPFDKRADVAPTSAGTGVPVSYGINSNILTQSSGPSTFDGNTTKYVSPSQLIYMAPNIKNDTTQLAFNTGTGDTNVSLAAPTGVGVTNRLQFLGTHAKRAFINALYADCHVASITYTEFTSATGNDANQARWLPVFTPAGQ